MPKYVNYDDVWNMLNSLGYSCETDEQGDGWDNAIDTVIEHLQEIPAADVQEVRHGKWLQVQGGKMFYCSHCNDMLVLEYMTKIFSYCPNCGARMDGVPYE